MRFLWFQGMLLGRYQLDKLLQTKSGTVTYAAVGPDAQPVEVRIFRALDPERWPTFAQRLRLLERIRHPALQRVLEIQLEQEPRFAVLERLDASSLETAYGSFRPIPVATIQPWLRDLAAALAAAHRQGLVHGDLKPGRIWKTTDGRLKLDFAFDSRLPGWDFAADIQQLGSIVRWLAGDDLGPLADLVASMQAAEPSDRPTAEAVLRRLEEESAPAAAAASVATGEFATPADGLAVTGDQEPLVTGSRVATVASDPPSMAEAARVDPLLEREQLGRYRLLAKLGEGGMGAVYKATDPVNERLVAIKVLRPDLVRRTDALRRFHREARLLAEVNNPYVANLLEINADDGIHFLALEFIAGTDLSKYLSQHGRLPERTAAAIVADVARALQDAHQRGIVHRDLKPENILLLPQDNGQPPAVKLTDFGLARQIESSESLQVTQAGAILGTPLYMSPEQWTDRGAITTAADVYSLGATLFHLLAGRPPFTASSTVSLLSMHCHEPAPTVRKFAPEVSEAIEQVVAKCLAKRPDARYPNAGALLDDLECLLRGEPTNILTHPRIPAADAKDVLAYDFVWELEAPPERLWPYVSNTDRINRAVGQPAVAFQTDADAAGGANRIGRVRKLGMNIAWKEHPFEWIEGRRLGVFRENLGGPFKWFMSVTELEPRPDGGTTLTHRVRLLPVGLLARTGAAIEIGIKARRSLEQLYYRIDASVTGKLGASSDPFEPPTTLPQHNRRRLDQLLERVAACGVEPNVVELLGEYLTEASPQDLARIRPLALARRLALDASQVLNACLYGTHEGLFAMRWDLLCPVCRIPSEVKETLKELREHGHCEACNIDFELNFAQSIELIFQVRPEIRPVETRTYCIGGPAHSPHVAAQVRLAHGERMVLELNLGEGAYRLRGPQLPFTLDFRVEPTASADRWELDLVRGPDPELPRSLRPPVQRLGLVNNHNKELVVRIERVANRTDAVTAARAAAHALFRELFPNECLAPGQLINVTNVTLLATQLEKADELYLVLGDARAFEQIHEHIRTLDSAVRREGGTIVKMVGEGVLASFHEPVAAVRAALALRDLGERRLRVAVHRGPAMVATINELLDYFGTMVNTVRRLLDQAPGGATVFTSAITEDEQVAALLEGRRVGAERLPFDWRDLPDLAAYRLI